MPSDFVIKTGDMIQVKIPQPTIVPLLQTPVPLKGSGSDVKVGEFLVCVLGDELPEALKGALPYMSGAFTIPGTGTLKLIPDPKNLASETLNGKPILIKGGPFQAIFTVQAPAMQPTPGGPIPHPVPVKTGTATFVTNNTTVLAG